ncbi:hypothetical protein HK101_003370 [Irineochytrium annulatum]|nr:hypothetical protein HK101_003370 [Irineochytrium annulatum]
MWNISTSIPSFEIPPAESPPPPPPIEHQKPWSYPMHPPPVPAPASVSSRSSAAAHRPRPASQLSVQSNGSLRQKPFQTGMAPASGRGTPSVAGSMASESNMSEGTRQLFKREHAVFFWWTSLLRTREAELCFGLDMMKASKLNLTQQRFLDELVKDGYSLPQTPTPGMTGRQGSASQAPTPTPSTFLGRPKQNIKILTGQLHHRPSVRMKETILDSDAFEAEAYRPKVTKNMEPEKRRLQWLMESSNMKDEERRAEPDEDDVGRPRQAGDGRHSNNRPRTPEGEIDEFKMVTEEIEERRKWLDDMISLGHGDQHKRQIQQEIALRIRRLEEIDRQRTKAERAALGIPLGPPQGGDRKGAGKHAMHAAAVSAETM